MRMECSRFAAVLATVMITACGNDVTPPPPPPPPTPTATPAPTPTPTPAPTMIGFWLVQSGPLSGYGIEVSQASSTSFRGRAVFPLRGLTGPTEGTVSASGTVRYDTTYTPSDFDSFDGQLDASRNSMTGTVNFNLRSVNFVFTFNNVTLVRQP